MPFTGPQVMEMLRAEGTTQLHHANTVTTALSFLNAGGLLSRGAAEHLGLQQTPQASDAVDQEYGVWHDVFLDAVDVHGRAGKRNVYGPVLFVMDLELLNWPELGEVHITRLNPQKWHRGQPEAERYYLDRATFAATYRLGDFDAMITVRRGRQPIPFDPYLRQIELDDPEREVEGVSLHQEARRLLNEAVDRAGLRTRRQLHVMAHACRSGCRCRVQYRGSDARWVRGLFVPT